MGGTILRPPRRARFFSSKQIFLLRSGADLVSFRLQVCSPAASRTNFAQGGREYKLSSISVPAQIPSQVISKPETRAAKLTLWPLVAATFFMVSGGTYGTEEIIHGAGYGRGILILLFLPVLWCLPTAFMIGELSSALPAEGGYYAWVR